MTHICQGKFAFIYLLFLVDITSFSPFLRGGSGVWQPELSNLQGSCTVSCLALVATLGEESRGGLLLPHPSTHHLPQLTRSQLYRKFTTLWPRIKVPFWINTKAIKCTWVVGLKYQSCFIAGIRDLFLAWYRHIKSEGLRGILMRW